MKLFKRLLLKPHTPIAALVALVLSLWQLGSTLVFNTFVGDCSPTTVAAQGDCVVYLSRSVSVAVSISIIALSALVLGMYVSQRRWWHYVFPALSIPVATVIFLAARTCTMATCAPMDDTDSAGCAVQICNTNPSAYLAWLIPIAAFALAGLVLWRGSSRSHKP